MDNSPQTESIVELVGSIEKGNVVLPEFQRNFVWEIGKTLDLFDSLVKDIFVGSIIYGIPSFEITVREIDKRPRRGKGSRSKLDLKHYTREEIERKSRAGSFRLVLDGQQRITSIYRALMGIDVVWFVMKEEEKLPSGIESIDNLSLEELLEGFDTGESEERLSVKLSDAFKIMEEMPLEEDIKKIYFNNLAFIEKKTEEEKKIQFKRYRSLIFKIRDLFKADKLLSFYLLNTTSEKFALFFERSNSQGMQLNFIDILAAKLYHGFNLREKMEEFDENSKPHILDREIIVRSIAFIVNEGKQKIDRSYILSELTADHFNTHWDGICDRYKNCLDFLYKNNFILSQSWMPYPNMLLPLIMFLREIGDFSQMNERQLRFIKFWYWTSIFAERYSGASNEITIQDAKILQGVAAGRGISDRSYFHKLLRLQITKPEEIYSLTKQNSAIYKGILNLINYNNNGLVDWRNTRKIAFNTERLDSHHVFPKAYVKKAFVGDEEAQMLINSVANRTLIPKLENIKIGAKAPSEYLGEIAAKNPKIEQNLREHLIPPALLKGYLDNEYRDFLEERSRLIYNVLEKHVSATSLREQVIAEFYQEPSLREGVPVTASYYNHVAQALFYPESERVYYKGQWYSPSAAGNQFKRDATGIETTTNGWEFWKFKDQSGQERFIQDLRTR